MNQPVNRRLPVFYFLLKEQSDPEPELSWCLLLHDSAATLSHYRAARSPPVQLMDRSSSRFLNDFIGLYFRLTG